MQFLLSCNETIDNGGGIYHCSFDGKKISSKRIIDIDLPMYVSCFENKIYVLIRKPFKNSSNSGLAVYENTPLGYKQMGNIIDTSGEVACHMLIEKERVFAVNYISGNVFSTDGKVAAHSGKGNLMPRQDAPHTHCIIKSPDGKYLLVTDLGLDKIFVYDKCLNLISNVAAPARHGPRHIVFSHDKDVLYCVNELKSSISIYTYKEGILTLKDTVYDENADVKGNTAAAIRISANERYVFISNRGADTISVFEADNGTLKFKASYNSMGKIPWDFVISKCEKFLLCANYGGNLSIIPLNSGTLSKSGHIVENFARPNCINII